MKTTIDLPDDLVRELKFRAVRDRRKFKDLAAELLRNGLGAKSEKASKKRPRIIKNKVTGLPMIDGGVAPPPHQQLTAEKIAETLLAQEVEWAHAAAT